MNCGELEPYLADALEGELEPARQDELLSHLEGCAACRAEYQAFQQQEARLGRYFKLQAERALKAPARATAGAAPAVRRSFPRRRSAWAAAAAAILIVSGAWMWSVYRGAVPMGHGVLARVQQAEGRIALLEANQYRPAALGVEVRQAQRIKVPEGGYLALRLPDGNMLEARGGTQLALNDFPDRFEVAMNRGQVWAHLRHHPKKPFHIKTAQLDAIAVGTVYGVEEGLDRSVVSVAQGTVVVQSGGSQTQVPAGESLSSLPGAGGSPAVATDWSRYPADLASLAANDQSAATPQLRVEAQAAPAATPAPAVADKIQDLLDLLPADTRYFLDLRDWPGILGEFGGSAYPALLAEPQLRQWWQSIRGGQFLQEFTSQVHLLELLDLARLLDGQLVVAAAPPRGDFLLLADCRSHEAEVRGRLEALLSGGASGAPGAAANPSVGSGGPPSAQDLERLRRQVMVAGGRLIIASNPEAAQAIVQRLTDGSPSGFTQSAFYRKLVENAGSPRFMMAGDLSAAFALDQQAAERGPERRRMLDLTGLPGLDYALIAPTFKGRGMNQAARIGFKNQRYGMAGWLAEPGPMRGFDFFSSDVHFFVEARLRGARQMFFDYLLFYLQNDEAKRRELQAYFNQHQAFFDAFGGEVAIGVDSPILPIPNIKLAVEVLNQDACEAQLEEFAADFCAAQAARDRICKLEESDYKGRTLHSLLIDGAPFVPSWTFVDDFLIAGPGPQFVQNSIDVYESKRSIAREPRLLSLLPPAAEPNFSLLIYQDIARSIPELLRNTLTSRLGPQERGLLPDLDFMQNCRAPGIAYANAQPGYIDCYLNTPGGVDLNVGVALPLVANWLAGRTDIGQTIDQCARAQVALEDLAAAARKFQQDTGRLPEALGELADPKYIDEVPADPFAANPGDRLRLLKGPMPGQITLYSIGPDGQDDQGLIQYHPEDKIGGAGDIYIRVPADEETTATARAAPNP